MPGPGGRRRTWSPGGMLRTVRRRCQVRFLQGSRRGRLGCPTVLQGGPVGESCVHPQRRSPGG
eukprot:3289040-Pyramimonas_sp.AAC.1